MDTINYCAQYIYQFPLLYIRTFYKISFKFINRENSTVHGYPVHKNIEFTFIDLARGSEKCSRSRAQI